MRLPAFTDLAVEALGWDSKPFILYYPILSYILYYRVDFALKGAIRIPRLI